MSDQTPPPLAYGPETQKQRWAKYGANVALVSVIVIVLGFITAALAQFPSVKARVDTTRSGMYSLKPQTKGIVRDLKEKVRIVSLYTQTKPVPGKEKDFVDYATPVADLLDEYQRNSGGKIDIEVIDPTNQPAKVDDLIANVTERYGGEVKQYKDFLATYGKSEDELKKLATGEAKAISMIDAKELEGSQLGQIAQTAQRQLDDTVKEMDDAAKDRERLLATKPPNYKGAVDAIDTNLSTLTSLGNEAARLFKQLKDDKKASEVVKKYAADATPRYEAIAKQATAVSDQIKKLGKLKLDDLRQTLNSREGRDSIVVMGPKDMRVLSFDKVWQYDANLRRQLSGPNKDIKRQFAGEQQITSAILALTQDKKPKVAFVRAGGPPLTTQGQLFGPPAGPLSRVAGRLADYNFEVLEKDLSGMWAMQQQMQQRGMPPEPEPDDAAIKDAIWIVVVMPSQPGPMGPPPQIASKVADHLKAGGSALFLCSPQAEDMNPALAEYGIKVRNDAVIVHEPVPANGAPGDFVNEAQRLPYVFVISDYGKHMLTEPLQSLDMPMVAGIPVSTEKKPGITQWNLMPIPESPPTWAETNLEPLLQGDIDVKFDEKTDQKGPLFAAAAAKKDQGEGRVIVLGTSQFATNDLLRIPDRALLDEQGVVVSRFPGSMELMTNSVFWLAKMEPMIAISPAAMDVSRIAAMSKGTKRFWDITLVAGLPLLVGLAGVLMYIRRRD